MNLTDILDKKELNFDEIVYLLALKDRDSIEQIFAKAYQVKKKYVGKKVYYRGLIEFSNICEKNCYYCGIRHDNHNNKRYIMPHEEVIEAAMFAYNNSYGSIVLQSGEQENSKFTDTICSILKDIKKKTDGNLGITLSVGEQTEEVYQKFMDNGAHRYLLRIETSNEKFYKKLHPADPKHSFHRRLECIRILNQLGYQTGSGVMIGLPFQTIADLANDLIFLRDNDIDMIGMGPYLEHKDTPLYEHRAVIMPTEERLNLSLKMIALARIIMKDINIASTTALQTIDPQGREKGFLAGANVVMPNITPVKYRDSYFLYEGKPCVQDKAEECKNCLERRILSIGEEVAYGEWGDPKHYFTKKV